MSFKMVQYFLSLHTQFVAVRTSEYMSIHYILQHYIKNPCKTFPNKPLALLHQFIFVLFTSWVCSRTEVQQNWRCLYWPELQKEDSRKDGRQLCFFIAPACFEYPPTLRMRNFLLFNSCLPRQKISLQLRAIPKLNQTFQQETLASNVRNHTGGRRGSVSNSQPQCNCSIVFLVQNCSRESSNIQQQQQQFSFRQFCSVVWALFLDMQP